MLDLGVEDEVEVIVCLCNISGNFDRKVGQRIYVFWYLRCLQVLHINLVIAIVISIFPQALLLVLQFQAQQLAFVFNILFDKSAF